ncbi:MAG TPA: GyrI-like domain-containing protein [Steroidobacteraceae bacterium]
MRTAADREAEHTVLGLPRFEHRKPLLIAGLRRHIGADGLSDIPLLWREFAQRRSAIAGIVGRTAYGVVIHSGQGAGGVEYLAAVEVANLAPLPAEFERMSIPAHQYAIFAHRGHVSALKYTMMAIWNQWLPTSGRVLAHPNAGSPDMIEYYGEDFDPETGLGAIEVWLPIKV